MSAFAVLAALLMLVMCSPPLVWIALDLYLLTVVASSFLLGRELALVVWPRTDPPPVLRYKDSALIRFVLDRVPRLRCGFRPSLWARCGRLQTISWLLSGDLCGSGNSGNNLCIKRQLLQMKDRGLVALDWILFNNNDEQQDVHRPILLLLPSFHQSSYELSGYAEVGFIRGMRSVVFQRRGHDGCPMTVPRLQPFGDPSDMRQAVRYLRCQYPGVRLAAVGVSSGASLLLSYLGEFGDSTHLSASAVVSPLWDPHHLYQARNLGLYAVSTVVSVKRLISANRKALERGDMRVGDILKSCWSLAELEKAVYAVPNGFEDLEAYWERNSPLRDVDEIAAPLLALNATDDPFYSPEWVPYDLALHYPNFLMVTTQRGGHAAFLDAEADDESWAAKTVVDYLTAVMDFESSSAVNSK